MQPGLHSNNAGTTPIGKTMRTAKSLAAAAFASLLVLGCEAGVNSPVAPPAVSYDFQNKPWDGVLPSPGTGTTSPEQFQLCKYGSSGTFSYTVKNNQTNVTSTANITVQDGECWVLAVFGGVGATVTVTETSAQAGYHLDHVDLIKSTGGGANIIVQPPVTSAGPSVTAVVGGAQTQLAGATAKFYNVANNSGEIGDFVWQDNNNNGIQDAGEPGIGGQTVYLTGSANASTVTDANGAYLFSGLAAGAYEVTVATPAGMIPSPSAQGGNSFVDSDGSPAAVTLATNSSVDHSIDFGFAPQGAGQIGDLVWQDTNGDGIQDAGEPGLPGLTVTLQCTTVSGAVYATTSTDANGNYLFTGLGAGDCDVSVNTPAGYTASPSNQGGDPSKDSNGSPTSVTLPDQNTTDLTLDFGFVPVPAGSIGDFVWQDTNGNGIQDAGEPGMGGQLVTLTGPVSATTTTNGFGAYIFTDLPAGCYTVTVGTPSGYTASPSAQGGNTNQDSNGSPAAVCLPSYNSTDLSVDFGFVPENAGKIGDFVWKDLNGNGVQDAGEPGIAGLTVTLSGAASASTTTDANGGYLFTGLGAGSYTVTVAGPAGYSASPSNQGGDPAKDSNGSPASVTLASYNSVNLTIDFGFVPPPPAAGQIGDYVWEDEDGDGVQDVSEPALTGLTVTLTGPVNATTTTDANGNYLFTGLPAGTYTVTVATPAGFTASPSNQGGDPAKDSNGSPAIVTLPTGTSVNLTIDFGFVPPAGTGRMTGGGQQVDVGGYARISRGLTLHCDIALSNNLEVNWNNGSTLMNFHITRPLQSARCILDPAYRQPPPAAPFNTFIGVANGTLNGVPGAVARFTFIDAGEPGRKDMAALQITAPNGQVVLNIPLSNLDRGNYQAHYDQPHGSNQNGSVGGGKK